MLLLRKGIHYFQCFSLGLYDAYIHTYIFSLSLSLSLFLSPSRKKKWPLDLIIGKMCLPQPPPSRVAILVSFCKFEGLFFFLESVSRSKTTASKKKTFIYVCAEFEFSVMTIIIKYMIIPLEWCNASWWAFAHFRRKPWLPDRVVSPEK